LVGLTWSSIRDEGQGYGEVLQSTRLTQEGYPKLEQKLNIDRFIGVVQLQDKSAEALSLWIYRRRILQSLSPFSSRVQVRIITMNRTL